MRTCKGRNGGKAPVILNVDTSWAERLTSLPGRFTLAKKSLYPLSKRLGGPRSPTGRLGRDNFFFTSAGIRTPNRPACNVITGPPTVSRLCVITCKASIYIECGVALLGCCVLMISESCNFRYPCLTCLSVLFQLSEPTVCLLLRIPTQR
jgi:hypothetical protein